MDYGEIIFLIELYRPIWNSLPDFLSPLFNLSRQVSSWTLILLTAERFISVWLPFKCKELCTRRRIVIAWVVISILLLGANMHFFFSFFGPVFFPSNFLSRTSKALSIIIISLLRTRQHNRIQYEGI